MTRLSLVARMAARFARIFGPRSRAKIAPKAPEPFDGTTREIVLQELYKRANRGLFVEVSQQLGVSHQFVGMVYRGLRRSKRVEDELRRRGAPLARPRQKAVKAA